jgi:hypothetical protein
VADRGKELAALIAGYLSGAANVFVELARAANVYVAAILSAYYGLGVCPRKATVGALIVVDMERYFLLHTICSGMKTQNQVIILPTRR